MAERRNYYEIIDRLSFDPIETRNDKIENAIELWKFSEDRRGVSVEDSNGKQRQQELAMYEDIKKCLSDRASRKAEADAMKQKQKKKLDSIIALLKENGDGKKIYVSEARVAVIAKSLRLAKETVKEAFEAAKVEVILRKKVETNKIPLYNSVFKQNAADAKKLSAMKDNRFPWLGKVRNLYDLAAFFYDDGANAKNYASKPAAELKSIMEAGQARFTAQPGDLNHCFTDLFSCGATTIFKDEAKKAEYDRFLNADRLELLFSILREMPEELKRDAYLADSGIEKIQKCGFSDPDEALAIYNIEAKTGQNPYEPASDKVNYVCGSCRAIIPIKYDAYKKHPEECVCRACGASMFVPCKSCSKLIPRVANICPECGFNLIESKFFETYFALAKSAVESMNIEEARKQLALAKNAYPGNAKLKGLEAEIAKIEKIAKAPLQEIDNLITQRLYMKAREQMEGFCLRYPNIKVDDMKARIDKKIADADKRFSQLQNQSDPCGVCLDILDEIKDYKKASEYIKDRKPKAVTGLTSAVSAKSGQITIQWTGTGERNVSYCVVRKVDSKPQSIGDGDLILDSQLVTQYTDSSVMAGRVYYYAVLAKRMGIYSVPTASTACVLLKEIDEKSVVKDVKEGKCALSWQLPKDCRGVRILRSDKGRANTVPGQGTKVIEECALSGYEDRTVISGTRYDYRLQCIYNAENGVQYSEGITFSVMPDSKPMAVTLASASAKDGNVIQTAWEYTHDIRNSRIDFYDITPGLQMTKGAVYPVEELTKIGTKIGTAPDASAKSYELRISQRKGYRLCAVTVKGEYAAVSNCISCSNYEKIEFDKEKTKISGGELIICLKRGLPQGVTGIRYEVATKNNDSEPAPWRGIENVQGMTLLPVSTYQSDEAIIVGKVPKKVLYISVIGEYRIGNDIFYSEPSKLRLSNAPKPQISLKMAWGALGQKKKNVRLIIECDTDVELPEMLFCCSRTTEIPMSASGTDIVQLCSDSGGQLQAHTKKEIKIADEVWREAKKGNEMKLFLKDRNAEFDIKPDSIKIP